METKDVYDKPIVEIIEFAIEESIAMSMNFGSDAICTEVIEG